MEQQWQNWDEEALANEAQLGLRGQGAVVEMMRRLKDTTAKLERATTKQQTIMIWLTVAILFFTVVMIAIAIFQ